MSRDLIVFAARGGGYAPVDPPRRLGPRRALAPHGIALTRLEPRFITAELTLAEVNPAMSELIPLAHESRANAERANLRREVHT